MTMMLLMLGGRDGLAHTVQSCTPLGAKQWREGWWWW